jgi:hypothetical protein
MSLREFGEFARETYLPAGDLALPVIGVLLICADRPIYHPIFGAFCLVVGALDIGMSYKHWKRDQYKAPAETLREPEYEI